MRMTRDDFFFEVTGIRDTYSVSIKGDVYYVDAYPDEDGSCDIDLRELEIPPNVVFENEGDVTLNVDELPENVEFFNEGDVYLYYVESIHPSVRFENEGDVYLESLKTIPPGVEFNNEEDAYLGSLTGGWFKDWDKSIKGIKSNELLNMMISQGLLDKERR